MLQSPGRLDVQLHIKHPLPSVWIGCLMQLCGNWGAGGAVGQKRWEYIFPEAAVSVQLQSARAAAARNHFSYSCEMMDGLNPFPNEDFIRKAAIAISFFLRAALKDRLKKKKKKPSKKPNQNTHCPVQLSSKKWSAKWQHESLWEIPLLYLLASPLCKAERKGGEKAETSMNSSKRWCWSNQNVYVNLCCQFRTSASWQGVSVKFYSIIVVNFIGYFCCWMFHQNPSQVPLIFFSVYASHMYDAA